MNNKRPVNLDISTIKLPVTAIVSILHRASGCALFAGVAVLLWILQGSLASEESFNAIKAGFENPICKLILWATLAGIAYHASMGVRHLIMDFGVGETLEGGKLGAQIALVVAVILIVLAGSLGMVTAITSFGRSGLYDWLIQRVSAVVMTAYLVFILGYIFSNPGLTFEDWKGLYSQLWMRVFSLITLISIAAHAWIGLWAVLTDYLTVYMMGKKATVLRVFAQLVLGVITVFYVVWGVEILWGI